MAKYGGLVGVNGQLYPLAQVRHHDSVAVFTRAGRTGCHRLVCRRPGPLFLLLPDPAALLFGKAAFGHQQAQPDRYISPWPVANESFSLYSVLTALAASHGCSFMQALFVALQLILPQHALSRLAGLLARHRIPGVTPVLIRLFVRIYRVNLAEAEFEHPADYDTFNAFFTRALKADARPLKHALQWDSGRLISPVDGTVSQAGIIHDGALFQAKGREFYLPELAGPDIDTAPYANGVFATLYLSPRDYHRIHMPAAGRLRRMTFIPGRLFSVNQTTTDRIDRLFARNERLVCEFETDEGPLLMVLVGAMIVGSIATEWSGTVGRERGIRTWHYDTDNAPALARGDEMGRFQLGSTVILITPGRTDDWVVELYAGKSVRVGEPLQ